MALIGKIRSNPVVVLLFIGGGILLFVLSDIMNSGNNGPIGPAEAMMARVGEVEIERNDFERTLSVSGNSGDAYQNRDNLWNFYLSEGLIRNETERLGLEVTSTELEELTYGPRFSPVIRNTYGDPTTGQLNTQFLNDIRSRIEEDRIQESIDNRELNPNFVPIWRYQNRQVIAQRLQEKLSALVSKAMYAPSWMAQEYADAQAGSRTVAVVRVPFDELDNSEVEVSDDDLQAYIDEYRSSFNNLEETRQLTYVSFNVDATDSDSSAVREQLNEIAANWRNLPAREDSLFALSANGTYSGNYLSADNLSPVISDEIMDVEVGSIYGPYVEGSAMKLAKVVDRREMADSVTIRRIVRNANTPAQFTEANRLIDSLQTVLQGNRGMFTELAEEFNRDPRTIATGGVLEQVTPGQLARSVDRIAFVTGNTGQFYKVSTPTNVQLVEVVRRSNTTTMRANVAYAVESMIPSKDTEDSARTLAEEFLTGKRSLEELKSAAEAQGLEVETTGPLGIGTFNLPGLGGGQDVRDMICWAFTADEGDVSGFVYTFTDPQLFYENKYVVVGVENIIPKGITPVAAVRENLEPIVRDRVKGRRLAEAMAGKDLSSLATQYDVTIDTLNNVSFTMTSLPNGIGIEPKVLAAVAAAGVNTASQPIVGNNGVYVVKPISEVPAGNSGNLPGARTAINLNSRSRVPGQLLNGLRAEVQVEDQRLNTECGR